jgi:hypothetical protein
VRHTLLQAMANRNLFRFGLLTVEQREDGIGERRDTASLEARVWRFRRVLLRPRALKRPHELLCAAKKGLTLRLPRLVSLFAAKVCIMNKTFASGGDAHLLLPSASSRCQHFC